MSAAKIVFVDTKDIEKDYLVKKDLKELKPVYIDKALHEIHDFSEIKDAEILSVFTSSIVKSSALENFENLKVITTRSTGYDHIDLNYCKKNNIKICNVPRYGEAAVAEFAFALLLNITRKVHEAYAGLQHGVVDIYGYMGIDLYGKTIGIIGTGCIGTQAIRIANGFCMDILAYDIYPKPDLAKQWNFEYVELDELYKRSDIISLHAPATKQNAHMLNKDSFKKMKKGVIIINTARGEIINTEDLYVAIKDGIVAGAGLDVLECEDLIIREEDYLMKIDYIREDCLKKSLINHKLLDLPNVIVTPHVAFDSLGAIQKILDITIDNIQNYLKGTIINQVNNG